MKNLKLKAITLLVVSTFSINVFSQTTDSLTASTANRKIIRSFEAKSLNKNKISRIQEQIKELAEKRNSLLIEISKQNKEAEKGTNSSGGGNDKEADFVSTAKLIYQQLSTNTPLANEILGIDIFDFTEAMDKTAVHCATGDILQVMRDFKKSAYFLSTSESIYLDCENYYENKLSGDLGFKTVFHEYMRAARLEGDEYKVSSKLVVAFIKLGLPDLDGVDVAIHECHSQFKNAALPNAASASLREIFEAELGKTALNCLFNNGMKKKANPNMSTSEIRMILGKKMIGLNLKDFANLVNSLIKR